MKLRCVFVARLSRNGRTISRAGVMEGVVKRREGRFGESSLTIAVAHQSKTVCLAIIGFAFDLDVIPAMWIMRQQFICLQNHYGRLGKRVGSVGAGILSSPLCKLIFFDIRDRFRSSHPQLAPHLAPQLATLIFNLICILHLNVPPNVQLNLDLNLHLNLRDPLAPGMKGVKLLT